MWIQRQGAHPGRAPAKKPRAGRPGAATVEFAVVAPVFFLLALGIIDVGRGLMVQHLMQNAARQGCRAGILPSNGNAEITAAVTGALQPAGISSESITVTVTTASRTRSTPVPAMTSPWPSRCRWPASAGCPAPRT